MIATTVDISELGPALVQYQAITGNAMADVIRKQTRKLGFALSRQLRRIAPEKGSVREERLAAMAEGVGLLIRDSVRRRVRAKRNRQRALVRRELSARESARGFLGYAAGFTREIQTQLTKRGRGGRAVGFGRFVGGRDRDSEITLTWGANISETSGKAAEGLDQPAAESAMQMAVNEVVADIRAYTNRKLHDAYRRRRA